MPYSSASYVGMNCLYVTALKSQLAILLNAHRRAGLIFGTAVSSRRLRAYLESCGGGWSAPREAAPSSASQLLMSPLERRACLLSSINTVILSRPALTRSAADAWSRSRETVRTWQLIPSGLEGHSRSTNASHPAEKQRDKMSTYVSSECRRVSPSVHGNKFDTAHRKKAVANIFENVNQDALMRLFQKTGDMKAEERVRSIFSYTQDPEETARALMALKQRKKDKFLQIAGMVRQLLKMRWLRSPSLLPSLSLCRLVCEPNVKTLPIWPGCRRRCGSPVAWKGGGCAAHRLEDNMQQLSPPARRGQRRVPPGADGAAWTVWEYEGQTRLPCDLNSWMHSCGCLTEKQHLLGLQV